MANQKRDIRIRVASQADRPSMCQLVVGNHLALSQDCPVEWMEQFREILDDYAHLFNADLFAKGFYHVAEEHQQANSSKRIVGVAGLIPKRKPKKSKTWIVTAVSVHDDCRRCGVGKQLMQAGILISHRLGRLMTKGSALRTFQDSDPELAHNAKHRRSGNYQMEENILYLTNNVCTIFPHLFFLSQQLQVAIFHFIL